MRATGKLTDVRVRTAAAGTHGDGGGLYLIVKQGTAGLTRSWLFRYSVGGRSHWMGLGAYPDVTLARVRERAQDARRALSEGIDPLQHKRDQRAALRQRHTKQAPTFAVCINRPKRVTQLTLLSLEPRHYPRGAAIQQEVHPGLPVSLR